MPEDSQDPPIFAPSRPAQLGKGKVSSLNVSIILLAILVPIGVVFYLFYFTKAEPENNATDIVALNTQEDTVVSPEPISNEESALETQPKAQLIDAPVEEIEQALEMPPLASYAKSDAFIKTQLKSDEWAVLGLNTQTLPLLKKDLLLQRGVAFFNGLSQGRISHKVWPFARLDTAFSVSKEGKTFWLDPSNYTRYNTVVQRISQINPAKALNFYRWTQPLWAIAYSELGYPAERLDKALISAIDLFLATPDIRGPIALKRDSVLYTYSDPKLEALAGTQKLLIRMGPKNRTIIKNWLRQVRQRLMATHQE